QEGDHRAFAIRAADMDHRREVPLGMIEAFENPPHAIERQVDLLGMKLEQSRENGIDRRHVVAAASSGEGGGASGARRIGDLVSSRHSRASVERSSWRCTTMSTMPCSLRYSARWKRSGSFSRMVCSMTRGPANPISAPGSAMWMSPSIA